MSSLQVRTSNLRQVFLRFRVHGLKLKPQKCRLFQERVLFLGHYVSAKGIEPNQNGEGLASSFNCEGVADVFGSHK